MLCYTFQLYYDFSGYSDIAIGLGRLFGFDIKENFDFPYISSSIGEFWRRWHISLGRWFREYLYISLGGNRKGNVYVNLFIVFLATGIWHGASWNFIIWGVLHGVAICTERVIRDYEWYKKTPTLIKWAFTFSFVCLTWVIFMTPDMTTAFLYLKTMFCGTQGTINFTYEYYLDKKIITLLIIGGLGAFVGSSKSITMKVEEWTSQSLIGLTIKEIVLMMLFFVAVLFMVNSTYSPFLYFQF